MALIRMNRQIFPTIEKKILCSWWGPLFITYIPLLEKHKICSSTGGIYSFWHASFFLFFLFTRMQIQKSLLLSSKSMLAILMLPLFKYPGSRRRQWIYIYSIEDFRINFGDLHNFQTQRDFANYVVQFIAKKALVINYAAVKTAYKESAVTIKSEKYSIWYKLYDLISGL